MADILLPPWLKTASIGFRYLDSTGVSRPEFTGVMRTGSRGSDRLAASLEFAPQATSSADSAQERATLIAFLSSLKGKQNRTYLTNPARRLRGSFPASELLTNNTFVNGTASWSTLGGSIEFTVSDRVGRLRSTAYVNSGIGQDVALMQYVPYALRAFRIDGAGSSGITFGPYLWGNSDGISATYLTTPGMITLARVNRLTGAQGQGVTFVIGPNWQPGMYVSVPYMSLSRCALVDNGPNLLIRSDDFFTSWTQVALTAPTANNTDVAPDGTTSAETLAENTANSGHYLYQAVTVSSAAADYTLSVSLKASSGSFAMISMQENTGGHECFVSINLSSGALGTPTASGANWTNPRAFVVNQGNGWWRLTIVGRKTNAATSITSVLYMADSLTVISYTGSSRSIAAWGASLAQSGVPVRHTTTTTVSTSGTAQTGSGIHIKGLPTGTGGLLMPGDEVEIISSFGSELKIVTAPLNSDAAGLGYLQFAPPIRGVLADNAAVIVHEPFGRFIFSGDLIGWDHAPGIITSASAEFEEAP